ncbi:MAG: hypothetical protein AMXMBFR46_16070 [Acidimicrobiia bacterium]
MGARCEQGLDAEDPRIGRRALVDEIRAHRPCVHFPVPFAELPEALTGLGCRVDTLTERGSATWDPSRLHQ